MLVDPPMEAMTDKATCAYELAVLVSKRASQLVDGAQPMIPDSAANAVSLACREIAQGKVVGVEGVLKRNEYKVPLTREAREAAAAERKAREAQESYRRAAAEADVVTTEAEQTEEAPASEDDGFVVVEVEEAPADEEA